MLTVCVFSAGSAVLPKSPLAMASSSGLGASNGNSPVFFSTMPATRVTGV